MWNPGILHSTDQLYGSFQPSEVQIFFCKISFGRKKNCRQNYLTLKQMMREHRIKLF